MKHNSIIFSGDLPGAIIDGRKRQTRRTVNPQPKVSEQGNLCGKWLRKPLDGLLLPKLQDITIHCPYGQPGDHLWVKETFFAWGRWEIRYSERKGRDEWHFVDMTEECGESYLYAADGVSNTKTFIKRRSDTRPMYWKRPSIFMPRRASRITLEIKDRRVERLQDISEADAEQEGPEPIDFTGFTGDELELLDYPLTEYGDNYRNGFAFLWESINGLGSWKKNPWVWVISFKRVDQ